MSSDASPRTKEAAAEQAEPEPTATPQVERPTPPEASPDEASPDATEAAGAEPAAFEGEPVEAQPADGIAHDGPESAGSGEPAEPEEPAGRIAGALDWAWDNRLVRVGLFAAIVIGVLAVWSSHDSVSDSRRGPAVQDAAVNARPPDEADIAKVAAAAGCTPKQTVQNSQYRQAACITPVSHLTITTFTTDTGQKAWLDEAIPYGGAYLIGKRWVVGANDTAGMNKIAASLGGTIIDHSKDHD